MQRMRMFRCAIVFAAVTAAGCTSAISGSADSISRWEKARAADPKSEAAQRSLGIAYFKANRYDDAHAALQQATAMDPNDGVAALYLGLADEAQNDIAGARRAYESYLQVGKTRSAKQQIQDRLAALKLKEIQVAAKQALARESELASVPGPANTVAVMPFTFSGADTSLKPLERGFAELITTDLSRVSSLTVVERMRLQALLDELALQKQAGVTEGTGVRAGKMLQVRRMVAGAIQQQGNSLSTSAVVTDVTTTTANPAARDERSLDDLFTMEKNIVLGLIASMNVQLTTAERNAIEQRPTRSLAAFLSYSRGLELEDQGRLDEAGRLFDNAVRIDPSFGSAQAKSQEAKSAATGSQVSANSVEASLRGSSEGAAVSAATSSTSTTGNAASNVAEGLNPSAAGAATTGGGSTSTVPAKTPSQGTGASNISPQIGKVTIKIGQPGHP